MEPNENKGPEDPMAPPPTPPPGVPPIEPPPVGVPPIDSPLAGLPTKEERTWALATHLAALVTLLGLPFGNVLGPLICWLIKKDTMPFVDDQGKEALNFQITQALVLLGCGALAFLTCGVGAVVAAPLAIADLIFLVVMAIIAAIKANEGMRYRYPLTWRIIK